MNIHQMIDIDYRCFEGETSICDNPNCSRFKQRVPYHPGTQSCFCTSCQSSYLSREAVGRIRNQIIATSNRLKSCSTK